MFDVVRLRGFVVIASFPTHTAAQAYVAEKRLDVTQHRIYQNSAY